MVSHAGIECFAGSHTTWAFGLGGSMLVMYAAGIPIFALYILSRIKGDLEKWRSRFGFLFSSYEPHCWYWEVVMVSKKGA